MKKKAVIYKSPQNNSKREHVLSLLMSSLLACLLLVTVSLFHTESQTQTSSLAQQVYSAESDQGLLSPILLSATPSAIPEPLLPFTLTGDTWLASSSPMPTQPADYCMSVPVLMYHHVQPLPMAELLGHPQLTVDSTIFEEQMSYLISNGYHFISAEELVNGLLSYQKLPEKSIVITIDDGYDDNYTYAFLVAKKYNILMNFMIPSALIDKPGYMLWDHLKEMNASPYAKIYNHTASHAALGLISEHEIDAELASSSAAFKEKLGLNNTVFVYPYGSFNDLAIQEVTKHGFTGAFSTIDGMTQCRSQIMSLPRTRIGNAPLSTYGL